MTSQIKIQESSQEASEIGFPQDGGNLVFPIEDCVKDRIAEIFNINFFNGSIDVKDLQDLLFNNSKFPIFYIGDERKGDDVILRFRLGKSTTISIPYTLRKSSDNSNGANTEVDDTWEVDLEKTREHIENSISLLSESYSKTCFIFLFSHVCLKGLFYSLTGTKYI